MRGGGGGDDGGGTGARLGLGDSACKASGIVIRFCDSLPLFDKLCADGFPVFVFPDLDADPFFQPFPSLKSSVVLELHVLGSKGPPFYY